MIFRWRMVGLRFDTYGIHNNIDIQRYKHYCNAPWPVKWNPDQELLPEKRGDDHRHVLIGRQRGHAAGGTMA